jgi:hypothetical protein
VELLQAIVYLLILGFAAMLMARTVGYVVLVSSWTREAILYKHTAKGLADFTLSGHGQHTERPTQRAWPRVWKWSFLLLSTLCPGLERFYLLT